MQGVLHGAKKHSLEVTSSMNTPYREDFILVTLYLPLREDGWIYHAKIDISVQIRRSNDPITPSIIALWKRIQVPGIHFLIWFFK